jgi:ATP-dependent DNA helicase RecQ
LQILYKGKELRKYIEKNAPLSSLVNVLVRLYPKITENYQPIDVIKLSKRTGVHLERLKEQLTALAQNGLADIDAWQCDTRLYFLEPREDKHTLSKVKKHLTQLKNTRKLQLKSIENYIKENEICKQSMIVKYFGEKVEAPCGQCSSCQSEPNSKQLQKRILEALQSHPLTVIELSQLLVTEEKVIIAALDEMINEEKIKRLNGKFHIQS